MIGDDVAEAGPGELVLKPRGIPHAFWSASDEETRLLGSFDPLLLGWTSRGPILGTHERAVVGNGMFRPVALAGGRAVAVWGMPRGEVVLEPFGRLSRADRASLEEDAADVVRYLEVGS